MQSPESPVPADLPELVRLRDEKPPRAVRREVERILREGGVVCLPTETVYGLTVRADSPDALRALEQVKGGARTRGLTWHVAARDALRQFQELRPVAQRLVERYWPGPLTLVLRGVPAGLELVSQDGWTGVRLPAHRGTLGLIDALDFPVVVSSANREGERPLTNAADVARTFGTSLGLILDGGPSRMGESSGVLRIGPGHFELLREGLLPIEDLRATAGLSIGFVCTGNTCRSPMAEGIAKDLLRRRLEHADLATFGFTVSSMGVFAGPGTPATGHAVEVLKESGIDISEHASSPALPERVGAMDRVYGLTHGHLEALRQSLPPGRAKHLELLDPEGRDIPDPIGGSQEDYRHCAARIREAVEARAADWA